MSSSNASTVLSSSQPECRIGKLHATIWRFNNPTNAFHGASFQEYQRRSQEMMACLPTLEQADKFDGMHRSAKENVELKRGERPLKGDEDADGIYGRPNGENNR